MPTPLEVLLDPISLGLILIYFGLILLQTLFPAQNLKPIKGWIPKTLGFFLLYFYLSSYLPLVWDQYLGQYQLLDLSELSIYLSTFFAVFVFEFLVYVWHRCLHKNTWLWRGCHQMHHSAERLDVFGAFYFSPLDIIGFTFVGSFSLNVIVGISPEATSYFLYITMFLQTFTHTNIHTPQWLGYLIQRPESHSVHHQKGVHHYNYSELPIFDMLFGTFKNPKNYADEIGFYNGSSLKTKEILMFKDVARQK
ncbi:sterol desaturase family protein [Thalassotalea litorea]|uniref:Sterol desaturase family protein n=1 Tax=Thalassotalea litorea TaxID=2020715 RepID=A0A5R9ISQ9_9GAMM|nr:sterol desaturase family protein [Thalassotalea litorea]TLU67087.1 sterol desaturase family protein [Thalassotalea litorea]